MFISKKILFFILIIVFFPLAAMEKHLELAPDLERYFEDDDNNYDNDYDSDEDALFLIKKLTSKTNGQNENEVFSPLHLAIALDNKPAFKKLLKRGTAFLNAACTFWQERPLHLTATQNNPYMLKKLIEKNVALNEQNMLGLTPLAQAVQQNKIQNVKILLSQQTIETQLINLEGKTALEIAKQHGHSVIGKLLITHCGLYTKHGLIAKEGLCQKIPIELANRVASFLIK